MGFYVLKVIKDPFGDERTHVYVTIRGEYDTRRKHQPSHDPVTGEENKEDYAYNAKAQAYMYTKYVPRDSEIKPLRKWNIQCKHIEGEDPRPKIYAKLKEQFDNEVEDVPDPVDGGDGGDGGSDGGGDDPPE